MKNKIQTIESLSHNQSSFRIRSMESFTYPNAVSELPELPHRHNFQELIWIKSGAGKHIIDDQVLEMHPETFYLIAKGQIHQFFECADVNGYVIGFADDFLPEFPSTEDQSSQLTIFNNINTIQTLQINKAEVEKFDLLLGQMTSEYIQKAKYRKQEVLGHMLQILLIKLERALGMVSQIKDDSPSHRGSMFRDFITHLEKHFKTQHHVSYYAQALNFPARQLSEITRQFVGKPAKQVIEERIILEAKRYLKFTANSVKETAYALGYKDPSYFSKVFKKLTSIVPKNYKTHSR